MIPEASLVAILIILFVADFISAKTEERKWFNPLASALLLANTVVCMLQLQPEDAFGGMYTTSTAINVMKTILAFGTFIVVLQSRVWAEKKRERRRILYVSCLYTFGYGGYDERRKLPYVLLGLRNGICSNGVRYCFRCLSQQFG